MGPDSSASDLSTSRRDDRIAAAPRPSALDLLQQVLTGRDETERALLIDFARDLVRGLDQTAPTVGNAVAVARAAYAAVAAKSKEAPAAIPDAALRPRVLVVDDSPDVLVALGAFVEGAGYEAVKAADAEEALRILATGRAIHVLVTDLAMPGASGVDLIAQVRMLRPELPALVITGYSGADALAGLPAHVEVLLKPFRKHEFVTRLRALMAQENAAVLQASSVSLTV